MECEALRLDDLLELRKQRRACFKQSRVAFNQRRRRGQAGLVLSRGCHVEKQGSVWLGSLGLRSDELAAAAIGGSRWLL
jgi:hypothetical protein